MKKKLLLVTFMVALLACFFAIAVSAAGEVTLTDGTNADLTTVFAVDGSTVKGFNTGYSKDNVKDVVFPDYITTIKSVSFESSTVLETVTFEAKEALVLDGANFKNSSVQRVTFNPECVLNYKSGSFYNCKSLTEITFPKFLGLTGNCFQFNSNMVPTNGIVFVEGIETIACHIFNGCTQVGGTVSIPSTVKEIKEGTFYGTKITSFDFSKCENLTTIGGGYGGTFANIDTVTSYDFSACTSLTTFNGGTMFEGSAELTEVILPAKLTKIPHKTFAHCYKMESIVIPASVTDIADESFHSARSGQTVKTFTMYIQGNVKLNTKYVFRDSSAKIEFVLLGDSVTAEQFKTTNAGIDIVQSGSHSPMDNIEVISYTDSENPWTFIPGQERTSHVIVEDYCTNLALKGEHLSNDNPCVIYCSDCEFAAAKEDPQHSVSVTIAYENGYNNEGVKVTACTNSGCSHKETEVAPMLFTCLGYSARENGDDGIAVGYLVNDAAIAKYTSLSGKELKYGVFVVAEKIGLNDVVNANGELINGALGKDLSAYSNSAFEIKIAGFGDDQKDKMFAIGAFVVTADGEISYMQEGTPNEGAKYEFISYNSVAK